MEELTKEELKILAELLKNAQVRVADAPMALQLYAKLERIIQDDGREKGNQES